MSTGKEIAARVAAEFGGVKPWGDRAAEVPDGAIVTSLHISSFMQAEIDELRAENERLKSTLLTNDTTIESANNAAGMLEAENARLRDALTTARTALIEHGSAYLHHELRYQEALDAARAALGEKA